MTPGRQILTALSAGCATTAQLAERIKGANGPRLRSCLQTLRDRALVTSVQGVHELTDKGRAWAEAGLEINGGPRPGNAQSRTAGTLRAKAWRYLRIRGKASLDDILMTVADGTEATAEQNLRRYLNALTRAGILARTRSGWVLPSDRNTGIEAPSWNTGTRTVTDVNTGEAWRI
jgi:hypothetical protein